MKKRPKLRIKTGKGPLYIQGDNAVELIMPEEPFRLSDRQPPEQVFPRETEKERQMHDQAMEQIQALIEKAGLGMEERKGAQK